MHRSTRSLLASLAAAACLWPVAAHAQTSAPAVQVEQVRAAFSNAGYQVDTALDWSWMSPPVTSFRVHDAAHDRVLMVLVYPSDTAALAGRLEAEAHEQALNTGQPVASTDGPHMVIGFGPSTWRGKLALVQSSESELSRVYRAQNDQMVPDPVVDSAPTALLVDLDFLQALDNSAVNL